MHIDFCFLSNRAFLLDWNIVYIHLVTKCQQNLSTLDFQLLYCLKVLKFWCSFYKDKPTTILSALHKLQLRRDFDCVPVVNGDKIWYRYLRPNCTTCILMQRFCKTNIAIRCASNLQPCDNIASDLELIHALK